MLQFELYRSSARPLHRQIFETLRRAIELRQLLPGASLPPTRELADRLNVSRNTVLAAYEQLAAEGWTTSRVGSGTRVVDRQPRPKPALLQLRSILREAHYPLDPAGFDDPDGNAVYLHRP